MKKTFNNPDSAEREYTRDLLWLSRKLRADCNAILMPKIGAIVHEFNSEVRKDTWAETVQELLAQLAALGIAASSVIISKLPNGFEAISKFNNGQFKMVVKANTGFTVPDVMQGAPSAVELGVNVFRNEPFIKPLAEGWIAENTNLIKSLPTNLNTELQGIVQRGVMSGNSVTQIQEQIKARYAVTENRARLIAQDQTLKLNANLTEYRLKSVGVKKYIWRTVHDPRVRPQHVARDGKEYTFKEGAGGENPGVPIRCRCRAEAIFE